MRALAATFAASALLLTGCASGERKPYTFGSASRGSVADDAKIAVVAQSDRQRAPRIEGRDLDGRAVDTSKWADDVTVINIWGSWCPPCRREAPALDRLSRSMSSAGVRFLGIAVREDATASRAFAERLGLSYPSISDPDGRQLLGFARSLPAVAVPTTYVVDRQGRIAVRVLDEVSEPTLRGLIEDVLAEEP